MKMKMLSYRVKFITPAFLGNAEQKGQWRTPPFKALLRHWWRVAYAKEVEYNVDKLRNEEARLFGSASDDGNNKSGKSRVRLRLDRWEESSLDQWESKDVGVFHKEVGKGDRKIGSQLYLGYGPLEYNKGTSGVVLKGTKEGSPITYISENSDMILSLIYPDANLEMNRVLQLIHWFGTIGGRSRNGWGSFVFEPINGSEVAEFPRTREDLKERIGECLRSFNECLELKWPHAVGTDKRGPLIWKTPVHARWEDVMKDLAEIKIAFRTALPFKNRKFVEERHILAYPITHHNVLGNDKRLANQMRFKVVQEGNRYAGIIFHLPAGCPLKGTKSINQIDRGLQIEVWQKVHNVLDSDKRCTRFS